MSGLLMELTISQGIFTNSIFFLIKISTFNDNSLISEKTLSLCISLAAVLTHITHIFVVSQPRLGVIGDF